MSTPKPLFPEVYGSVHIKWCYLKDLEKFVPSTPSDLVIDFAMIDDKRGLRVWLPPRHKLLQWSAVKPGRLNEILVPNGWVKHLLELYPDGKPLRLINRHHKYMDTFKHRGYFVVRTTTRRESHRDESDHLVDVLHSHLKAEYDVTKLDPAVNEDPIDGSAIFDTLVYDTARFEGTFCTYISPNNGREQALEMEKWFPVTHEYTGQSNFVRLLRAKEAAQS